MNLYINEFIEGMLEKLAESSLFDNNNNSSSILPTLGAQARWACHKHENKLSLHDGRVIHTYELPEKYNPEESFIVKKVDDMPMHLFPENTSAAQVHYSSPVSLYFTLQDGKHNPTYKFKYVQDNTWHAIPKTKKAIKIDKKAFEEGLLSKTGNLLQFSADHPIATGMAGVGLGAAYDIGKRSLFNTVNENEAETPLDRLRRYLVPGLVLGGAGKLTHSLFPNLNDPIRYI